MRSETADHELKKPNVVIFTCALSVLSKPQNPNQKDLSVMETATVDLVAQTILTLLRIYHTAGPKEIDKQMCSLGKEASQTKRAGALMRRQSSKPSPAK